MRGRRPAVVLGVVLALGLAVPGVAQETEEPIREPIEIGGPRPPVDVTYPGAIVHDMRDRVDPTRSPLTDAVPPSVAFDRFGGRVQSDVLADTITVPGDYSVIQDAIEAAVDGDTIVVGPGYYEEHLDLLDKSITLESAAGPLYTTIASGVSTAPVITVPGAVRSYPVIRGLRISGWEGTASGNPIVLAGSKGSITLEDNFFDYADGCGAVKALSTIDVVITGNTFLVPGNYGCNAVGVSSTEAVFAGNTILIGGLYMGGGTVDSNVILRGRVTFAAPTPATVVSNNVVRDMTASFTPPAEGVTVHNWFTRENGQVVGLPTSSAWTFAGNIVVRDSGTPTIECGPTVGTFEDNVAAAVDAQCIGTGNLAGPPLFVAPGDPTPAAGSPQVDLLGSEVSDHDLLGNARPVDGNADTEAYSDAGPVERGGSITAISGLVTDDEEGAGLDWICVTAFGADGSAHSAMTDATGGYFLPLDPGTYRLRWDRCGHDLDNIDPRWIGGESYDDADDIVVVSGELTDVSWSAPSLRRLKVLEAEWTVDWDGHPGLCLDIIRLDQTEVFRFFGDLRQDAYVWVRHGDYKLLYWDCLYGEVGHDWAGGGANTWAGATVLWEEYQIDAEGAEVLVSGAWSGRVTTPGGLPISGITVYAEEWGGFLLFETQTDALGDYYLLGLQHTVDPAYRLGFLDPEGIWLGEFFDDETDPDLAFGMPAYGGYVIVELDAVLSPVALCDGQVPTMWGTAGVDTLNGTTGNDVIVGGAGDDLIFGKSGNDRICAGLGNDYATGDGGDDRVFGEAGDDLLEGFAGNDVLSGGEGRDLLRGHAGHDHLLGGDSLDILRGGDGDDIIDGGGGKVDRGQFGDAPGPVNVNLVTGVATGFGTDTVIDIEIVRGSIFDDVIVGDGRDNRLTGTSGNDQIWGGAGADLIKGSGGNDTLYGELGDDVLQGGDGDDILDGGDGSDQLVGGSGSDSCANGEVPATC